MAGAAQSHGARQAGLYLGELFRGQYRPVWLPYSRRARADEVNALAVAKVLSSYLHDFPERPGDADGDPLRLKDAVVRAIRGQSLSRERLEQFINAFHIDQDDADLLRRLWGGLEPGMIARGTLGPLLGRDSPAPKHRTIHLHEFHYLGPDGQPRLHRTGQVIQALVDNVEYHRYSFDTKELTVERIHGGIPSSPYQLKDSVWAVDIRLPKTLMARDTAPLEYVTSFHYSEPVEPCFRRAAHQRMEDVVIRIEFDPAKLPTKIWWAEWEDYRGPAPQVIYTEEVSLDAEHSVHRILKVLDRAVVGFLWEF